MMGQETLPMGNASGTPGVANAESISGSGPSSGANTGPIPGGGLSSGANTEPIPGGGLSSGANTGPIPGGGPSSGASTGPIPGGGLRMELSDSVVPGGGQSDHASMATAEGLELEVLRQSSVRSEDMAVGGRTVLDCDSLTVRMTSSSPSSSGVARWDA